MNNIIEANQVWSHYKNKPNDDSLYKIIGVSVLTKGHVTHPNYTLGTHSEDLRDVVIYKTHSNKFKVYYCKVILVNGIEQLGSLKLHHINYTCIIYQHINTSKIWVRPLTMFVDKVQLPSGKLVNRFERIN